jgi:hypothetical protein
MNKRGINKAWKFNEWYHGQSGRPMGFADQSRLAALYLYAADAVQHGAPRVFEPASGWGLAPTVRR